MYCARVQHSLCPIEFGLRTFQTAQNISEKVAILQDINRDYHTRPLNLFQSLLLKMGFFVQEPLNLSQIKPYYSL